MSSSEDIQKQLVNWFDEHKRNRHVEVEARLRTPETGADGYTNFVSEIPPNKFEGIKKHLQSNKGWSRPPGKPTVTVDILYPGQIRQTTVLGEDNAEPTYMQKERLENLDHGPIRYSLSREDPCSAPASNILPTGYRFKKRHTFCHKDILVYELTEVRNGLTEAEARAAPTTYEVEIEFVGHAIAAKNGLSSRYLAQSIMMKMADLTKVSPVSTHAHGNESRVLVRDGFVLTLDKADDEFGETMTSQQAKAIRWLVGKPRIAKHQRLMALPGTFTREDGTMRVLSLFEISGHIPDGGVKVPH